MYWAQEVDKARGRFREQSHGTAGSQEFGVRAAASYKSQREDSGWTSQRFHLIDEDVDSFNDRGCCDLDAAAPNTAPRHAAAVGLSSGQGTAECVSDKTS